MKTESDTLMFKGTEIVKGTPLRIKNKREIFKFIKCVTDEEKEIAWIDVMSPGLQYHSFYLEELKEIVKPKRRRKKNV